MTRHEQVDQYIAFARGLYGAIVGEVEVMGERLKHVDQRVAPEIVREMNVLTNALGKFGKAVQESCTRMHPFAQARDDNNYADLSLPQPR